MSAAEAIRKREMFEEVDRALASLGVQPDAAVRYWVPGRIEVLGKHTDYAGGRSLLCAIERGFCFAAIPRPDDILRMHDALIGETVEIRLHAETRVRPGHWSAYPTTVAQRLAANFSADGPVAGGDVAFISDLPIAAGISSSSALVV
ncbi:MAG TPA: galactokinase family protein, partial [Gemmatimonadaceae bacterium]|nr:galactokinase family protein [Gemmatimonadaceae bacterium]